MSTLEPHYARIPRQDLPQIKRNPFHAVIDNFRSAYNVGSVFRTADAGAIEHIHLCGMSAHPPHRKIEKTSLGAFEYVPWTYYERTSDALDWLRRQNVPIVAIEVVEGAVPHTKFKWPQPVAAVFGNEVTGINEKIIAMCDATVCIPMSGFKNSINVATAYGIIQYEILRQWNAI